MTAVEWEASSDPTAMIGWLAKRGYAEALWDFTIACCRRVWHEFADESFRRVVDHFDKIGAHDIEDPLAEAHQALQRLERRLRKAYDEEEALLSRRIGFGRMVLAFEQQDAASAAKFISRDLEEWADDADAERLTQANSLRLLVADPSERV